MDTRTQQAMLAAIIERDGPCCFDCGGPLDQASAVLADIPLPDDGAVRRPRVLCRPCAKARGGTGVPAERSVSR